MMTIDRICRSARAAAARVHRHRAIAFALTVAAFATWSGTVTPASAQTRTTTPAAAAPAAHVGQAAGAPAGRVDVGAVLYRKVGCFQCHVNEAQGGANGPRLGPDPVPFARFSQYTRKPTGDMPPYSEKVLSAQDMADIYAFVRSRPRPPAVSAIPLLAP
jgi:mono/diheme cytochrome c family protein